MTACGLFHLTRSVDQLPATAKDTAVSINRQPSDDQEAARPVSFDGRPFCQLTTCLHLARWTPVAFFFYCRPDLCWLTCCFSFKKKKIMNVSDCRWLSEIIHEPVRLLFGDYTHTAPVAVGADTWFHVVVSRSTRCDSIVKLEGGREKRWINRCRAGG